VRNGEAIALEEKGNVKRKWGKRTKSSHQRDGTFCGMAKKNKEEVHVAARVKAKGTEKGVPRASGEGGRDVKTLLQSPKAREGRGRASDSKKKRMGSQVKKERERCQSLYQGTVQSYSGKGIKKMRSGLLRVPKRYR